MSKDFKSFLKNGKKINMKEDEIKGSYDSYKNKSQSQLEDELSNMVEKAKQMGNFDPTAMKNMLTSMKGQIPPAEFERIMKRIDTL